MLNWINIYWEKIVRSYKWAKFGWNDNDYDYTQIFEAIIFKLKAHSKAMCEHHKNDIFNDNVIDMNIAADWIRRVIDEENLFSVSNILDEKYGPANLEFEKETGKLTRLKIIREKVKTDEDYKIFHEEMLRLYNEAEAKDDRMLKGAFDLILQKHKKWWF